MTEEFFFHYTTEEAAIQIVLDGEIEASLGADGDAVHGEGVYLTTLEPKYGLQTIMKNNWGGAAADRAKVDAYFEILLPSREITRAKDKRDIQVYKGTLKLSDYKWNLRSFDTGDLLATQYFMISSEGEAMEEHSDIMGRYKLSKKNVTNCPPLSNVPVYKKDGGKFYLYLTHRGNWIVSDVVGHSAGYIFQLNSGEPAPSPLKNLPWQYSSDANANGWKDDDTLKVYPCY